MKVHHWPPLAAAAMIVLLAFLPGASLHLFAVPLNTKASPRTNKIVIMPLGDSITFGEGSSSGDGYRFVLWQLLTTAGIKATFVGSERSGSTSFPQPENEGHPGWRIAQISAHIVSWLRTYRPDYVLLQIGTNDIVYKDHLAQAPARLKALIDKITATLPGVTVLVAEITPLAPPREALVVSFNSAIPGIVRAEVAAGKHVRYVDIHDSLSLNDLLADKIHPDDAGYTLMANTWYQALYPLLKTDTSNGKLAQK
ncbi:MAG TPA: SGNH/GDSL hydrolase family protein [Ktedonobacteraceae bacterium]|jgi:lysophospholipase L1-like esterase|nr:SGNH/GDSL hydrolase family protein [Ktedonobacteraceae bacterium]